MDLVLFSVHKYWSAHHQLCVSTTMPVKTKEVSWHPATVWDADVTSHGSGTRAVRFGEADHPGPPRRITGTLRLPQSGDSAMTSSDSIAMTAAMDTAPTEPATTDTLLSLESTPSLADNRPTVPVPAPVHRPTAQDEEWDRSNAEGPRTPPRRPRSPQGISPAQQATPSVAAEQAAPVMLKLSTGDTITLVCRWIKGT